MTRIQFPVGAGNFSLHHRVQNGSVVHPAYPMGARGSFFWKYIDWGANLTTHMHLVIRIRMRGVIPLLPVYVFIVWCLLKQWIRLYCVVLS
jgi:hypothetical protein